MLRAMAALRPQARAVRGLVDVFGPEAVVRLLDEFRATRGPESDEVRRRLRRLGAK